MKTVVVGTAGHIDHGKSSLVKALTGTDPDRWEEERRRGITIDLGFAHRALSGDLLLDFVDVPGHERFVKNMLAGAGGIDVVLFVIAADESIKPQTREHFDICRLLGVRAGVVALTKCDLVTSDALDLVRLEAEEFFTGSFLAGAPIVPVSAVTREGLDLLLEKLRAVAADAAARDAMRPVRLPIDRAFVMKGFGAVVTGTLHSGTLERETEVEIYPVVKRARIRGIQVHGAAVESARAGQRTAVNLAGVDTAELARGMVLAPAGRFRAATRIDVSLTLLPEVKPLKNRAQVHFHCGTAECIAEVTTFAPYAQIRLREPVLLLPGDRFILRQFSPVATIGGGVVLDNAAPRYKKSETAATASFLATMERGFTGSASADRASHAAILDALLKRGPLGTESGEVLARTGWSDAELQAALRGPVAAVVVSDKPLIFADHTRFAAALASMQDEARRFHDANPLQSGITREDLRERTLPHAHPAVFEAALAELTREKILVAVSETLQLTGRGIVMNDAESGAKQAISTAFEQAGLAVPSLKEVLDQLAIDAARKQRLLQILLKDRTLVRVSPELIFHASALSLLRGKLSEYKMKTPRINVGQFKDLTGVSRKYAIPLLEYLDRERVTRRSGDERIIL